jgi:hypothetical protein
MVLRFDQSEAQLSQPPEARQEAPGRTRLSEEDQAQEQRRSIAENLAITPVKEEEKNGSYVCLAESHKKRQVHIFIIALFWCFCKES